MFIYLFIYSLKVVLCGKFNYNYKKKITITIFIRHLHVVFDVPVLKLNLSIDNYGGDAGFFHRAHQRTPSETLRPACNYYIVYI